MPQVVLSAAVERGNKTFEAKIVGLNHNGLILFFRDEGERIDAESKSLEAKSADLHKTMRYFLRIKPS